MNREQAQKLINTAQALGSANEWNMLDKLLWLVDAAEAEAKKAMPKDCDLIFWNGPKYSFYTESLEMGEQIVKHLPNSDDFTATALSQKAMPEDAEPVAFINIEKRRLEWNTDFPVRFETPTIVKMDRLPLYAHPPKDDAERVALLERIDDFAKDMGFDDDSWEAALLRDIRAYLGGDA